MSAICARFVACRAWYHWAISNIRIKQRLEQPAKTARFYGSFRRLRLELLLTNQFQDSFEKLSFKFPWQRKIKCLKERWTNIARKNSSVHLSRYSIFIVLRVQRIHLTIHVFFHSSTFHLRSTMAGDRLLGNLKKLTGSEQLPYLAYVTAFLQTSLFLDIF